VVLQTLMHQMVPEDVVLFPQMLDTTFALWNLVVTLAVQTMSLPMAMPSSSSLIQQSTRTTSSGARATTQQVSRSWIKLASQ